MKKVEVEEKARNMLIDPEAYETYIRRQEKHRNTVERTNKREKSLPGSGRVWTSKVTKTNQFNLLTESKDKSSLNIKSVNKPINPNSVTSLSTSNIRINRNPGVSNTKSMQKNEENYVKKFIIEGRVGKTMGRRNKNCSSYPV